MGSHFATFQKCRVANRTRGGVVEGRQASPGAWVRHACKTRDNLCLMKKNLVAASQIAAHAHDVSIGPIIGAPVMLATVAMLVTGTAIFIFTRNGRRNISMNVNSKIITRDIRFFILAFSVAIASSFIDSETPKVV